MALGSGAADATHVARRGEFQRGDLGLRVALRNAWESRGNSQVELTCEAKIVILMWKIANWRGESN